MNTEKFTEFGITTSAIEQHNFEDDELEYIHEVSDIYLAAYLMCSNVGESMVVGINKNMRSTTYVFFDYNARNEAYYVDAGQRPKSKAKSGTKNSTIPMNAAHYWLHRNNEEDHRELKVNLDEYIECLKSLKELNALGFDRWDRLADSSNYKGNA